MNHRIIISLAMLLTLIVTSCGSSNTPSGVVEQSLKAFKNGNYKEFVSLVCGRDGEALSPETQAQYEALFAEKGKKQKDEDVIKSWKILSEEIAPSGNTATVTYEITTYGGTVQEQTQKVIKGSDGKWRMSLGK
ncbi:MAG: DUF4878 domain-containing protein [Bacteroidales bacterium]|nr:DUF4878 domain-containing protein [Bacteroidales bacterium]